MKAVTSIEKIVFPAKQLFAVLLVSLSLTACGGKKDEPVVAVKSPKDHEHVAPHGGTPVELGKEEFHIELVRDAAAGILQAYVLDGELEKFIRIPAESIEITAKVADREEPLSLKAVANHATGETAGNTSLFEGQADWLKQAGSFEGEVKHITINGHDYDHVRFSFSPGKPAN